MVEVVVGDDADSWRSAGFTVDDDVAVIAGVRFRLVGSGGERGVLGCTVEADTPAVFKNPITVINCDVNKTKNQQNQKLVESSPLTFSLSELPAQSSSISSGYEVEGAKMPITRAHLLSPSVAVKLRWKQAGNLCLETTKAPCQ